MGYIVVFEIWMWRTIVFDVQRIVLPTSVRRRYWIDLIHTEAYLLSYDSYAIYIYAHLLVDGLQSEELRSQLCLHTDAQAEFTCIVKPQYCKFLDIETHSHINRFPIWISTHASRQSRHANIYRRVTCDSFVTRWGYTCLYPLASSVPSAQWMTQTKCSPIYPLTSSSRRFLPKNPLLFPSKHQLRYVAIFTVNFMIS